MAVALKNGWQPGQDWNWQLPGSGANNGAAGGFQLDPLPQQGNGAFGVVPGSLGLPNPAGDLGKELPGLPALNQQVSGEIGSELGGELSPETLNALRNANASWSVNSGMPGSGLSSNRFLGNVAGAIEARKRQGIEDYSRVVPTVSGTQTVRPELQNEIATQNSLNRAAPNPAAAASHAEQLYNQYLQKLRGPGGGTGGYSNSPAGGTGSYAPSGPSPFSSPLPGVYDPNQPSSFSSNGLEYSNDPSDPFANDFAALQQDQESNPDADYLASIGLD